MPPEALELDTPPVRRHLTGMTTVVSTKGQIVLPAEIRRMDDVKPGHHFEVERLDCGEYRLKRIEPTPNEGLVDWLLACPAKGFLEALPPVGDGETTEDIQPGLS